MRDLSDPSIPEFERPAAAEGLRLGLNQANDLGWKYNICNWLSTCIKKSKDYFFSVLSEEQDKVSQEWGENDEGILLF